MIMRNLRYMTADGSGIYAEYEDGQGRFLEAGSPLTGALHAQAVAGQWGPIAPYTPPAPTLADYERAIQAHIDATARTRGYRSGDACASYTGSTVKAWAAEAAAFVAWRDAIWQQAFADMGGGVGTPAEYVAGLPAIKWPAAT